MNDTSPNSLVVPLLIGILIVLLAIGGYVVSLKEPGESSTPTATSTSLGTPETPTTGEIVDTAIAPPGAPKPYPTCKISTRFTSVSSINETITFSWTSVAASIIRVDKAVDPFGTVLPPEGTASVVAREGLSFSKPTVTSADQIKFRFEAVNKTGLGTCWLILPYKPS